MPTLNYNFPIPSGNDSFKASRDFKNLADAIDSTLKQEVKTTNGKIDLQEFYVDVRKFGGVGDGVANDTAAIKAAIAEAKGRTIFFAVPAPALSATYKVTEQITIPNGTKILSRGNVTILRSFTNQVGYALFLLQGNNLVDGLTINGGNSAISVPGQDFTLYADIFVQGSNVTIQNTTFDKSCGSSIVSGDYSNLKIIGNTFRDYLDHAIYMAGRVSKPDTSYIEITSNTFITATSTREVIKVRNGVSYLQINKSTINAPNATFFTFDVGDATGDKANNRFTIEGNVGVCQTLIASLNATSQISDNLLVNGNNVYCNGYIMLLGFFPTASEQKGTSIGTVKITGNNLNGYNSIILNGQLAKGIERVIIHDNQIAVYNQSSPILTLIGTIKHLELEDNFLEGVYTQNTSASVISVAYTNDNAYSYKSTSVGNVFLDNNKVSGGFYSLIHENSTSKSTSLVNWNLYVTQNKIVMDANFKVSYVFGSQQSAITTWLYQKDNLSVFNKMQSTEWNPLKVNYQDMKPVLNKTYAWAGATLGGVTPLNIDIPFTGATANDRVVANAKFGINPAIIVKSLASSDSIRIQLFNASSSNITIGATDWLVTLIKADSGISL